MQDEVISELWAIKDEIAKSHDYDIDMLFEFFKNFARPADALTGTGERGHARPKDAI